MNTLKGLQEKLGAARKKLNQFTNDRAEKLNRLTALGEKNELNDEESTEFDTLTNEIDEIDKKMKAQQTIADNLKEQVNHERLNGDSVGNGAEPGNPGFIGGDSGPTSEEKEISKYSIVKAFREAAGIGANGGQNTSGLSGFEKEMHQEAQNEAREFGYSSKLEGNLQIPQKVMHAQAPGGNLTQHQMRQAFNALTATGGTDGNKGGVTVQTEVMSLIDILRAKLPFVDSSQATQDGLGATFFTQLEGDLSFPKAEEDESDPAKKGETAAADEQDPTMSSFTLKPNRLPTFAEVSRQLLMQSSADIENWLRNYLMYKLNKSMQKDIIDFLLALENTNSIIIGDNGGPLDWDTVVKFETEVEDADAGELEPRLAYFTNAKAKGHLKTTRKGDADSGIYLWDRDNQVNNYDALISSLVPKNLTKGTGENLAAMIFANWSNLFIGQWGGLDTLINPYSRDKDGLIRLNLWTFFDRNVRHNQAFSVCKEIDYS